MPDESDLFRLAPDAEPEFEVIGGKVPVVLVDGFYAAPDRVRDAALQLRFEEPKKIPYPGKLASIEPSASLAAAVGRVTELATHEFLRRVPIRQKGNLIDALRVFETDFAVVDVHPDDLEMQQRKPHVDPAPAFALVYLNREERGGTLFFEQITDASDAKYEGYFTGSDERFRQVGRIEPKFNRLAIYPGFVLHSGEIAGDWIEGNERFRSPRLTQRFVLMP